METTRDHERPLQRWHPLHQIDRGRQHVREEDRQHDQRQHPCQRIQQPQPGQDPQDREQNPQDRADLCPARVGLFVVRHAAILWCLRPGGAAIHRSMPTGPSGPASKPSGPAGQPDPPGQPDPAGQPRRRRRPWCTVQRPGRNRPAASWPQTEEVQMKIFVTGATGFVGRALVPAAAARGPRRDRLGAISGAGRGSWAPRFSAWTSRAVIRRCGPRSSLPTP